VTLNGSFAFNDRCYAIDASLEVFQQGLILIEKIIPTHKKGPGQLHAQSLVPMF